MPEVSLVDDDLRITHYDANSRDAALLRWSLWMASKKRCYICAEVSAFGSIHVDHLLPKHLESEEFSELWTRVAGSLPNFGPHHISNLRACCSECNSARLKGAHVLPDTILAVQFAKSEKLAAAAFVEQRRMRRDRAVGESAVKVTSASHDEEFALLWQSDLSQSLLQTLHVAARTSDPTKGDTDRFSAEDVAVFVRTSLTPEATRLMGAVQLVTGVTMGEITAEIVGPAVTQFEESHRNFAESTYPASRGANSGEVDWTNAEFTVSWDSVTIDEQYSVCEATVTVDSDVSAGISLQSSDGADLLDVDGPDCTIDGFVRIEVHVATDGIIDEVVLLDNELEVHLANSSVG